jgi:hypothetical protein
MLEICAFLAVLFTLLTALYVFNEHCKLKFGHAFFSKGQFYVIGAGEALVIGGNYWIDSANAQGAGSLNGWAVVVVGAIVLLAVIFNNFKSTNIRYGIGGTLLQLPLFAFIAYVGYPILLFCAACLVLSAVAKTDEISKKKREQDDEKEALDWYHNPVNPNGLHADDLK